ncbi:hypothetical protein BES34_016270 [Leptospira inadai serovar Lyme]|uniref:Lipoprotein n=1 Tax=Leptospira inadai serovar Lyme TaxID=293084 RepID=A0ABX4YFE1_9LEPT|nr:hypothetical protein [Leptospira inadai]PNV73972.1 hypothetical protein BES34_016270 [Leptospira inadai serovar Lyme]
MKVKFAIPFLFSLFSNLFFVLPISADGCYLCAVGSADSCRDYCRFSGPESFDTRKKCENKGCKVAGIASCPTASNSKVCVPEDGRQKIGD